jgi:hypothetical protein
MNANKQKEVHTFAEEIRNASDNQVVEGVLTTSERVLKRVTDGIYRQPSSALRELISNAYDADATLVEIQTDPPRFDQIIVRDNGNGLTAEALSSLIHNIGGSSKRTAGGAESAMGVCKKSDPMRSPGGRKLIGKIGIGLFSVSQLTKEFQIITKTKGANHRTVADVVLHTYSEDAQDDPDQEFKTGTVKIWKAPAADTKSHGTEVILRNLLQKTKDDLTSKEIWDRCNPENHTEIENVASATFAPPAFHIGCVHDSHPNEVSKDPTLPWKSSDVPAERFRKFVQGVHDLRKQVDKNPSIDEHLDYYLRMLWVLSLSAPVDYLEEHPFDLGKEPGLRIFKLGNNRKDQANELKLGKGVTIRKKLQLVSPERGGNKTFRVLIDGMELFRPALFKDLPTTLDTVPYSLLFVGKAAPDLSSIPSEIRGGELEFEAYFLWSHKVIPREHAGILLRINDSNGSLFDDTFMSYPVSEQRRKNQVTAEIFVTKGLDAALNIDRESFNYAHPHFQYVTHWVHNAFRQLANRHKSIAKENRDGAIKQKTLKASNEFEKQVDRSLRTIIQDEDEPLPVVEFTTDREEQAKRREAGVLAFDREHVFEKRPQAKRRSSKNEQAETEFESKIAAVAKVLDAYGVLDGLPYEKQQELMREIVNIFSSYGKGSQQ